MAAAHSKSPAPSRASRRPWSELPIVAACAAAVAVCMVVATAPVDQGAASGEEGAAPVVEQQEQQTETGGEIVGSYEAISQGTDTDRAENLRLAAEAINGTVIQPGETFSFNDCVGDVGKDPRYRDASVIAGDAMVDGAGGGICQVSTALYIAALKADLEIVERHPHSIVSDYAPVGLDATLVYGTMDLKIQNNGDAPVRIVSAAVGQTVKVFIVGHPLDDGVTIDATSKVIGQYADDDGSGSQLYYVAESYRVYYQDGVKQYSDQLSTDTYLVPEPSTVILSEGSVEPTK